MSLDNSGPGEGSIRFSVKEMLAEITEKLDKLNSKIETLAATKADGVFVARLDDRITNLEKVVTANEATKPQLLSEFKSVQKDVEALNKGAASAEAVAQSRRWIWGVGFAVAANTVFAIIKIIIDLGG